MTERADIADPDALGVRILVDGRPVHSAGTGGTFRGVARLLGDISEFMTLAPGDLLLAGVAAGSPRVSAGDSLAIEIDGLGRLEKRVVAAAERRRRDEARTRRLRRRDPRGDPGGGARHAAPGRRPLVAEEDAVWLAPFEVGTIVALGLNYADHAKELAFAAQDEPLVFLKGPGSVIGHRGRRAARPTRPSCTTSASSRW